MFVLNLLTYGGHSEFTVHNHQIMLLNATTLQASNYMISCPLLKCKNRNYRNHMPPILYLLCSLSSSSTNCELYFSTDPLEVGKPKRRRNSSFWQGGVVSLNVEDSSNLSNLAFSCH